MGKATDLRDRDKNKKVTSRADSRKFNLLSIFMIDIMYVYLSHQLNFLSQKSFKEIVLLWRQS